MADTPTNFNEGRNARSQVIDPTANVLKLVEQAMLRQDDLRKAESARLDAIASSEKAHATTVRELESKYRDSAALAETRRVDAVIAQQAQAVILASTRAELTASALAERVDTSARTLAESVKVTADANAAALTVALKTLTDRIDPLERFRYEMGGRSSLQVEARQDSHWTVGQAVTIALSLLAIGAVALEAILRAKP